MHLLRKELLRLKKMEVVPDTSLTFADSDESGSDSGLETLLGNTEEKAGS